MFALNGLPDQTTGTLNEGELVSKAALQQDTYAKVPGHISHCDQGHVLGDSQVHQLVGFDQDEKGLGRRSLDFGEFSLKILDENIVQTPAQCNRLLADEFEAPVQRTEDFIL